MLVLVLGCFEVFGTGGGGAVVEGLDGEDVGWVIVLLLVVGSWLGFSGGVSKSWGFFGRCFAFHCAMHREGKRRRSSWIW